MNTLETLQALKEGKKIKIKRTDDIVYSPVVYDGKGMATKKRYTLKELGL